MEKLQYETEFWSQNISYPYLLNCIIPFLTAGFWDAQRQTSLLEWGTLCCFDLHGNLISSCHCINVLSSALAPKLILKIIVLSFGLGCLSWPGPKFQGSWSDYNWILLFGLIMSQFELFFWGQTLVSSSFPHTIFLYFLLILGLHCLLMPLEKQEFGWQISGRWKWL